MTQIDPHPSELRLVSAGRILEIEWIDGGRSAIAAERLRAASRSAGAVRAALDGRVDSAGDAVAITGAEPVGAYAVRLAFSDGHDRGIFPWTYLRELCAA